MKHWDFKDLNNGYSCVFSDTMKNDDGKSTFKLKREVYKEFKELELKLFKDGFAGWVSGTNLKNAHVMKMYTKYGAKPYQIKGETIWFFKNFNKVR